MRAHQSWVASRLIKLHRCTSTCNERPNEEESRRKDPFPTAWTAKRHRAFTCRFHSLEAVGGVSSNFLLSRMPWPRISSTCSTSKNGGEFTVESKKNCRSAFLSVLEGVRSITFRLWPSGDLVVPEFHNSMGSRPIFGCIQRRGQRDLSHLCL